MKYTKVFLDSIGYELAPVVITTEDIEEMLQPFFDKLNITGRTFENLTGISERRWWESGGAPLSDGAVAAAKKVFAESNVKPEDVDVLIYGGVCREGFEPATACKIASALEISPDSLVYDLSNACLGVMNGIVEIANRIELGQSRAGLIVSSESAREINEITIQKMLADPTMPTFIKYLATLTGGSGSVALLLTDGSFNNKTDKKLLGGVACSAPEFHKLCTWGMVPRENGSYEEVMLTDSVSVLKNGIVLSERTWNNFLEELNWRTDDVDKIICHQVGSTHQNKILKALGIPKEKDFDTFPFLGNIGSVSLPITAAIAEERKFLNPGENVGFLGIGSGLNCIMLGWQW
ncbi:MAG: 3-oxoacyl-ACP synthase III [Vulcanimicrobiota bacterium]